MAFQKGRSGNPSGRPQGLENKVTREIRALTQKLFDKDYWTRIRKELKAGELNPMIEAKLLAYAWGEPKQVHEHEGPGGGPIRTIVQHTFMTDSSDAR